MIAGDSATHIHEVRSGDSLVAIVVRSTFRPDRTTFVTAGSEEFQLGFGVYDAGQTVVPHIHPEQQRSLSRSSELLIVREGVCIVEIYDDDRLLLATETLTEGDIVLSLKGGHSVRAEHDTVLLEVKQGPYEPGADKETF